MSLNHSFSLKTHNTTLTNNTPIQIDGSQASTNKLLNTTRKLYICMVGGVAINEILYVNTFPEGTIPSSGDMTTLPYATLLGYQFHTLNVPQNNDRVGNTVVWFMGPGTRELSVLEIGVFRP